LPSASDDLAIKVENLSITYQTSSESAQHLNRFGLHLRRSRRTPQEIRAVRDISFEIPRGVVLGLVGHNGSGKSTLLRALAGVLAPTEGTISLFGRVTPLLSLGVGFNPMLSGRENILLGGLCAGMTVTETRDKIDEIIDFSELGDAIDRPIRTYSNGMYSRLGFSVAALLEPEIILIDEVLAAGDAAFMLKSSGKIKELAASATTVVLVSHVLGVVRSLSDTCMWMERGQIRGFGDPDEVLGGYMDAQGIDRADVDRADDMVAEWVSRF
jgi:ABC-type polysaccharide/polyol phosphate transport system ATPase subunit